MKIAKKILWALLLFVILPSVLMAQIKTVVPGVTLEQIISKEPNPQLINIVRIDLRNPSISIKTALADPTFSVGGKLTGKQPVSTITQNNNAVVGINADYFIMESFRDPLNLCIVDGDIISEPGYNRSVILFDNKKDVFFDTPVWNSFITFPNSETARLNGVNRFRNQGEIILYTNQMGNSTLSKYKACDFILMPANNSPKIGVGEEKEFSVINILSDSINPQIPKGGFVLSAAGPQADILRNNLKTGDTFKITFSLSGKNQKSIDWQNISYAAGGGPLLVLNGCCYVDGDAENMDRSIVNGIHPRSAVGLSADKNTLFIVTVDGRQNHSKGVSLQSMAEIMIRAGAYNAMNLDGGGSTALSICGMIVNSPSGISERSVANTILVLSDYKGTNIEPNLNISGTVYRSGNTYDLIRPDGLDDSKLIWAVRGGIGYALSDNIFRAATGDVKGQLGFIYDGKKYSYPVEVSSAALNDAVIDCSYYDSEKILSRVSVTLLDSNSKPMIYTPLFIDVEGGRTGKTRLLSDNRGMLELEVFWDTASAKRLINVSLGDFKKSLDVSLAVN